MGSLTCEEGGNISTRDLVLFTSHPNDGLVVNLYIPNNRWTPLKAEEDLGAIPIPRSSRGVSNIDIPNKMKNKKYHTVEAIIKFNSKMVER